MPQRIRILACSFALGVGMLLLGATAAHATPQSGAHVSGQLGGGYSPSPSPSGGCRHHHHCNTPSPPRPRSRPAPRSRRRRRRVEHDDRTAHAVAEHDQPDDRAAHAGAELDRATTAPPTPLTSDSASATAVPTGGANTGGGGSIGGGGPNMPLVAGGAALALGSAGLGLAAYRRYRKSVA